MPSWTSARRSWAQLIKRTYEVDPLVCPSCGGEMKVIAFIIEHEVVDAILRHLKRKEERRERAPRKTRKDAVFELTEPLWQGP